MRTLLRHYVITLFSFWAVVRMVPGIELTGGGPQTFLIGAAILFGLNLLVKPVLKIALLPITVLTLGMTFILINTLIFYGLDYLMPELYLKKWDFNGVAFQGVDIPSLPFGIIATYILGGTLVSGLIGFLKWL